MRATLAAAVALLWAGQALGQSAATPGSGGGSSPARHVKHFDPAYLEGPAAGIAAAWLATATEGCTGQSGAVTVTCRTRDIADGAAMHYLRSARGGREWAVMDIHTMPDPSSLGRDSLVAWRHIGTGYTLVDRFPVGGEGVYDLADDGGTLTYSVWTKGPKDEDGSGGTHQRFRAVSTSEGPRSESIGPPVTTDGNDKEPRSTQAASALKPRPAPATSQIAGISAAGRDYSVEHNGSIMLVSPRSGTISYIQPSATMAGTVSHGTIVFRGFIGTKVVAGHAYAFKRGCPPAPYSVTSRGPMGANGAFLLIGDAPVRAPGSCAVTGYAATSANSVLRFEPGEWGDE